MSIANMGLLYRRFINLLNSLQSPFLLLVRVYWGWQFWQTGWGKLQDISKPIEFFTSLGIPFPALSAWIVACIECFGGILLLLGLASRLVSIPLVINMSVAFITADREALKSIISEPAKFYGADPFTFWMAALLVLVFGPGLFSIDYLIVRYAEGRRGAEPLPVATSVCQKL